MMPLSLVGVAFTGFFAFAIAMYTYILLSRYLLVKNTAYQTIRSVPNGFAELHGRADPTTEVVTPLSKVRVVAYRLEVSFYATQKRDRIATFTRTPRFTLNDGTGSIAVDAPRSRSPMLFRGARLEQEYLLATKPHSATQREGLVRIRSLSNAYERARKKYPSGSSYEAIEELATLAADGIRSTLEGFERVEPVGRVSPHTLKVKETAVLPRDEMFVMGSVTNENGERLITRGAEGVFFIGNGVEAHIERTFVSGIIGATVFFIILALATLFLLFNP